MTVKTPTLNKTTTRKKVAATKPAAVELAKKHQETEVSFPDERHRLIAEAAYLIAEERNFYGDLAFDDWLQAEAEIDALYADKQ